MEGTQSVVGIDPSLTGLAVCTMRQDLSFEMKRFSSKPAHGIFGRMERYTDHADEALNIVADASPQLVFLEHYSFGSRGSAILDMAEFGGVLRTKLVEWVWTTIGSHHVEEIAPSSLKRFASGKGNTDKMQTCIALSRRYDVQFDTSDEFDAYCLARMAACYAGFCEAETDFQRAVLDGIRSPKVNPKKKVRA